MDFESPPKVNDKEMKKELKFAFELILSDSIKKAIKDGCLEGVELTF